MTKPIELPCPSSPNCVSSLVDTPRHFVAPLQFSGDPQTAWRNFVEVVTTAEGAVVEAVDRTSLHATFTSSFFGFVDDVFAELKADDGVIHIRSSSRTGYYDFGVNRKRVENLRQKMSTQL